MVYINETTEFKLRRGTASQMASFVGAQNELTLETDTGRMVLHDGVTPGGAYRYPIVGDIQKQSVIYCGTATGSANALVLTASPTPATIPTGARFVFKAASANTGAATANINGTGVVTIKKNGGADDLVANDMVSGGIYELTYDGTNYQVTGGLTINTGVWKLLEAPTTLSGGESSVDFTNDFSPYAAIRITVQEIQPTSALALWLRVSVGSFQTTGYTYAYSKSVDGTASDAQLTSQSHIGLTHTDDLGISASVAVNRFEILISNPNNTTDYKAIEWRGGYIPSGQTTGLIHGFGYYGGGTGAIDGIRIMPESSTLAEGYFEIHGLVGG